MNPVTVSQLNHYIKHRLESDEALAAVAVKGEISNFKLHYSGHIYMTIKDESSAIRAVMFKGAASGLKFTPQNGMKIIALGRIGVYERDGQYQLYVEHMKEDGVGDLYVAFEQLKQKLLEEGLFDAKYKKPLPRFPRRIAVVTSSAGAAIRDILHILKRRYPYGKILICPVLVQGTEAAGQIANAIAYLNQNQLADVMIIGRGGGSIEDLWAFNEEAVARAVFASQIPVISAVGHETDTTISDFAADMRAPTPSAAAELVAPSKAELLQGLEKLRQRLLYSFQKGVEMRRERVLAYQKRRPFARPQSLIEEKQQQVINIENTLLKDTRLLLLQKKEALSVRASKLDALSPLGVLGRGYAIAQKNDGAVIKSVQQVEPGDMLFVRLKDGKLFCQAKEKQGKGSETI